MTGPGIYDEEEYEEGQMSEIMEQLEDRIYEEGRRRYPESGMPAAEKRGEFTRRVHARIVEHLYALAIADESAEVKG